jgi:membrane protease YdiL (CAAX protease family)
MNFTTGIKEINWLRIFTFYIFILIGTFLVQKIPNLLHLATDKYLEFNLPWNINHGIIIFIISILFYKFSTIKTEISFLGKEKFKNLLFPVMLFTGYSMYGFRNNYEINEHLWAFLFCSVTIVYDIMEEYTWRGYLNDSLGKIQWIIKSIITGIVWTFWHLLIFGNFDQFGGFAIFMLLCIVFSFVLTFSVIKTNSIIVPATIHALFAKTNIVTLILFVIFIIILILWNKKRKKETSANS